MFGKECLEPPPRQISSETFLKAWQDPACQHFYQKLLRRFRSLDFDNLQSAAQVAMWKTLSQHDFTKAQKFSTSFYFFLKRAFIDLTRHSDRRIKLHPLEHGADLAAVVSELPEHLQEEVERIRLLLPYLKRDAQEAVRLLYLEGWKTGDVAEHLNLSPSFLAILLNRAIQRLKDLYLEAYPGEWPDWAESPPAWALAVA